MTANGWRTLLLLVAGAFVVMALHGALQKKSYKVIIAEQEAELAKRETRLAEQETLIQSYKQQEQDIAEAMRKQAANLDAARAKSKEAMAELRQQQADARKGVAAWAKVYAERPELCKAALVQLEASCPSLSGY